MKLPNRVPQPTAVYRDPDAPWDLTGSDEDVIIITNAFTYAANEETCLQTLCAAHVLAACQRTTLEDYVIMLSKRIHHISRLMLDGYDGLSTRGPNSHSVRNPEGPLTAGRATVNTLNKLVQTGMQWLEQLAEIEIQSKQRWFQLRRHGYTTGSAMTPRETMKYDNIRTTQESWDRKRKALLGCAMAETGPKIVYMQSDTFSWDEFVDGIFE
ncbi:MAG: hypothetical protein Q9226_001594 [Calogaya cf. arnoldii]